MSLANISIVGNLVKPPEQMYFSTGNTKTTMVLAINNTNRNKKDGRNADFYKVEVWGKLADLAGKYLEKGNQVAVSGRLVMDHWTDRHGNARMTPIVEANQLSLPPKGGSAGTILADDAFGGRRSDNQNADAGMPGNSAADDFRDLASEEESSVEDIENIFAGKYLGAEEQSCEVAESSACGLDALPLNPISGHLDVSSPEPSHLDLPYDPHGSPAESPAQRNLPGKAKASAVPELAEAKKRKRTAKPKTKSA